MRQTEFLVDGFTFGEGPRWHDGRLWFSDGPAGRVLTLEDGELRVAATSPMAQGLGWLDDGSLVVSSFGEAAVTIHGADGPVRHDLSHLAWSTNDVVVRDDRIWVDLYQLTDEGVHGAIALVAPDGDARIVATDIDLPNGLVATDDGTLLVSETFGERILAFTVTDDGDLVDRRVFAELGGGRKPDGLSLDAEGALWAGCYDTGEFIRVRDGGEVTDVIPIEPGWAVAPALGGPDGRTLFLVIDETTHEDMLNGVSVGRIETVEVEVPGIARP